VKNVITKLPLERMKSARSNCRVTIVFSFDSSCPKAWDISTSLCSSLNADARVLSKILDNNGTAHSRLIVQIGSHDIKDLRASINTDLRLINMAHLSILETI
jgi:tRNA threonylcarbamoyladenosine modification (KEOPS) complex  Pcc1 subunit